MRLLTVEDFARCVNQTFVASLNDGDIEFTLVEARPLPTRGPQPQRVPFCLLFRNSAAFLFPQQVYLMREQHIGEVGIFLVPVAREREGFLYEAVFN